jgi:hypothetical protein
MFRRRIDGEKRYASPEVERLYQKWLDGGAKDFPVEPPEHTSRRVQKVSFDSYWIPSLY